MKRILPLIMALILSIFSSSAYAQLDNPDLPTRTGYKVGNILIHGAFKTTEQIETNIFLDNANYKADSITTLYPSGGIEIPLRDHKISADYECGIFMYAKYPNQGHIDHRARGLVELNFTDYKITINDVYRDYTDRAADESSNRVGRINNNLRAGVEAQFNKFGVEVAYSNIIEAYTRPDDLVFGQISYGDRANMTHIAELDISYRFMPKTTLFVENDLGFIDYYNSSIPPDAWYVVTFVGIRGRPTNKISANIKGGMKYQGYSKSDVYNDKAFFGPQAAGGVDYYITDKDTLNFGINSEIYESTYANMNYYYANMFSLRYSHRFNDKFMFSPYGSYQLTTYPSDSTEQGTTAKRADNLYKLGVRLRYDINKWSSCEFRYEFSEKHSNFSNYDYVDNQVFFTGTVGL